MGEEGLWVGELDPAVAIVGIGSRLPWHRRRCLAKRERQDYDRCNIQDVCTVGDRRLVTPAPAVRLRPPSVHRRTGAEERPDGRPDSQDDGCRSS